MKSERVLTALGIVMALTFVLVLVAKRRAEERPEVDEAPSDGASDSPENDQLVDEMGRESFPASDPPATY
jgi:hypothetical protein